MHTIPEKSRKNTKLTLRMPIKVPQHLPLLSLPDLRVHIRRHSDKQRVIAWENAVPDPLIVPIKLFVQNEPAQILGWVLEWELFAGFGNVDVVRVGFFLLFVVVRVGGGFELSEFGCFVGARGGEESGS